MINKHSILLQLVLASFVICCLPSCNIAKYLDDKEYLVKKNKVVIDDDTNSKGQLDLISNLESFILQKPNRNYLGFVPREWLYLRNQVRYDTTENKKGILKEGELPVIFDRKKMVESSINMEKYLRFSKGFYFAKVFPKAIIKDNAVFVEYRVVTDFRYTVKSKEYFGNDTKIINIIKKFESGSNILPGAPVDESVFESEKTRIVHEVQKLGYANFNKSHIDFKADSTGFDKQMDIFVTILGPANNISHRKYSIGDINVYTDYGGRIDTITHKLDTLNNINYYYHDEMFIRSKTLDRAISFRPGELYRKNKIDNSYAALANLSTYRFINILPTVSTTIDTVINYEIFLTPIELPWSRNGYFELFYRKSNNNLLGVAISPAISNINLLGGGEKFSSSLQASTEIDIIGLNIQTLGVSFENKLSYPTLLDKYGESLIGLFARSKEHLIELNNKSTTDIELTYSLSQQTNLFTNNSFNLNYGYSIKPNARYNWFFTPLNINFLISDIDANSPIIILNPLLKNSFDDRLVTGFGFQELTLFVNTPVFTTGFSYTAKIRFEQSGGEVYLANLASKKILNNPNTWELKIGQKSFEFAKFGLIDLELTSQQRLTTNTSLAGRFRFGIAKSYGNTTVPFVKQFYIGGANSLRAWAARELGPGGYSDLLVNPVPDQPFFQTGDLILEGNLEYRFPIWWILDGALFLDAGNIWVIDESLGGRPDSEFAWNTFADQIAVGYGFGVRMDLSFLVIRIDMGYKLRLPYKAVDTNSHWVIPEFTREYVTSWFPNLAISYPF